MDPTHQYKTLLPIVRRILLERWDPIGVNQFPEARDEYDSYAPAVVGLLLNGAPAQSIADHLRRITTEDMGLRRAPEHELEIARELLTANALAERGSLSDTEADPLSESVRKLRQRWR